MTAAPMGATTMVGRGRMRRLIARTLCLLPASYFLASVVFALLHFDDFGAELPQFLRYVAGPLALALLFIWAALRLKPTAARRVGSTGLAMLLGLFAFETVMTVRLVSTMLDMVGATANAADRPAEAEGLPPGRTLDALNKALGVTRMQEAFLGGIPDRRVQLCSQEGRPIYYTADRYGFNNPDSVYDAPASVMVLGDSFVEGICLPREQSLVGQLRQAMPGTVGIGTRGAGPVLELATLGRFGPMVKPRTIVMAYFEGNDWENLSRADAVGWLRKAVEPNADFGPAHVTPATLARAEAVNRMWATQSVAPMRVIRNTQIVRNFLALNQSATAFGLYYPKVSPEQPIYGLVLARARQLADGMGARLVLVYIPAIDRFTGWLPRDFVWNQQRRQVFAAAQMAGIDRLDLTPVMRAQPHPAGLYAADGHFNADGARIAAAAIAAWLQPAPGRGESALPVRNGYPARAPTLPERPISAAGAGG